MADWSRVVEIFAGRSQKAVTRQKEKRGLQTTIATIAHTIEILEKRIQFLHFQINEAKKDALAKGKKGDRQLAISCLLYAKNREKARQNAIRHKDNIVSIRGAIEESTFNKLALDAIKSAHTFFKKTKMPKMEEVDQMLDDIVNIKDDNEQMLAEVSDRLQPVYDEDDLEKELDELMEPEAVVPAYRTSVVNSAASASVAPPPRKHRIPDVILEDPSPIQEEEGSGILLYQ
jgi:hypothetical protein